MQYRSQTVRNALLMIVALLGLSACAQASYLDPQWQNVEYSPADMPYNGSIGPSNSIGPAF